MHAKAVQGSEGQGTIFTLKADSSPLGSDTSWQLLVLCKPTDVHCGRLRDVNASKETRTERKGCLSFTHGQVLPQLQKDGLVCRLALLKGFLHIDSVEIRSLKCVKSSGRGKNKNRGEREREDVAWGGFELRILTYPSPLVQHSQARFGLGAQRLLYQSREKQLSLVALLLFCFSSLSLSLFHPPTVPDLPREGWGRERPVQLQCARVAA
jgi:hypothetical protein